MWLLREFRFARQSSEANMIFPVRREQCIKGSSAIVSWIEYRVSATFQSPAPNECEHLRREKLQTTNAFMDVRKLRDYYLSFYAPKFLIPISRSRLSVVMSHFLISARSDYYAIEPLYKTLISRYMSCGGELATTLAALYTVSRSACCLAAPFGHFSLSPSSSSLAPCVLRWTIVCGFIVRLVVTPISALPIILLFHVCVRFACSYKRGFNN